MISKLSFKSVVKLKGAKFILLLIIIAALAPILSNERPLLLIQNASLSLPFTNQKTLEISPRDFTLYAPIPYNASTLDYQNMGAVGPFERQELKSQRYRHWLGTDELGRDITAGLISGSRTAVLVGFSSMLLACCIALILGGLAGYFGDEALELNRRKYLAFLPAFTLSCFYIIACFPRTDGIYIEAILLCLAIGLILGLLLYFLLFALLPKSKKSIQIPVDRMILRIIELLDSIPVLFLIVALSAAFNRSYIGLICIIASVAWTGMARHTRAQVLKVKEMQYVESGLALGYNPLRILRRHILPNSLGPILISLAFGIGSAILFESTLSFLGIGLGVDQVSWGSLLAEARADYAAWWLAVFPGCMLFLTLFNLNRLGDQLSS